MKISIESYADLGRTLGISRQAATKLARSDLWSFGLPPWSGLLLPAIQAHHRQRRMFNNATVDSPMPGVRSPIIRPADFRDPAGPWYLGGWCDLAAVGDDLLSDLARQLEPVLSTVAAGNFDDGEAAEALNLVTLDWAAAHSLGPTT